MALKALLTVDLKSADPKQRGVFDDEMEKLKWTKLKSATTSWKASFKDDVSRSGAIATAEGDVAKAASRSQIKSYSGAIQLAAEPVEEF